MFGIDPIELLDTYGYLALFIGTFLEGETIVLIAGFLAQQGLLKPPLIALAAFCGSVTSDQLMFTLGRWKGVQIIQRFPRLQKKVKKASKLLSRYETPLILGFRFVYGVRNVTPILMGVSGVSRLKFTTLNVIGAAAWSLTFTYTGFFFGHAVTAFHEAFPHAGRYVFITVAAIVVLLLLWRRQRRKKKELVEEEDECQNVVSYLQPVLKKQDDSVENETDSASSDKPLHSSKNDKSEN